MTKRMIIAGFLTLSLVACSQSPSSDDDTSSTMPAPGSDTEEQEVMEEQGESSQANEAMMDDASSAMPEEDPEDADTEDEDEQPAAMQPRVIDVSVENWKFSPNAISLKKGETVRVRLQGIAGTHGFAVPGLGINTSVAAGKTVEVAIPTDAVGSFNFFCSIPCGSGHRDMTGMITISE